MSAGGEMHTRPKFTMSSARSRTVAFALMAMLFHCASLNEIPASTCGNGVVDANEDCDSFPEACGKPGTGALACRVTCDRKLANSCPVGWGCSVEGFCRQSTGNFEPAGVPGSAGVLTLLTGDFDGDGRTDLVGGGPRNGTTKPRVHFFDSSGVASAPVTLPFPVSTPVVRDFDGDGRDDLAFAINSGSELGAIGLLAGTADRAFSSVLFPTVIKRATDLRGTVLPHDPAAGLTMPLGRASVVTLERDAKGTFVRSVSSAGFSGIKELEQAVSFGPEQVLGGIQRGRLFDGSKLSPPSTCGELVIPYNVGAVGHLAILSPCASVSSGGTTDVGWSARPIKDVTVPGTIVGRTFVGTFPGLAPGVVVATDRGTFYAASTGTDLGSFERMVDVEDNPAQVPLAIEDIDGDGTRDFIVPTGAYVSKPSGDGGTAAATTVAIRPNNTGGRWADARTGKFNGDDLVDVVGFSSDATEVEMFANAGAGRFTRFSISSTKPVRALATGDFDGDRIQDVAFLASSSPLGKEEGVEVELLIAYGKASGGPEPARVVGRFAGAVGVAASHEADQSVDDIIVLDRTPATTGLPTTSLTLLVNSGDRQSIAPVIFSDAKAKAPPSANQARFWLPAALVAAPLVDPGAIDIMAIAAGITLKTDANGQATFALPFPTGSWLARGDKSVVGGLAPLEEIFRFPESTIRAVNDDRFQGEGALEMLLVSAAADVDATPDGVAEVVTLARGKGETTAIMVVRSGDIMQGKTPTPVEISDFAVTGEDELGLMDLDGDELPDAVVLTRGPRREKVRVYLNDGNGSFTSKAITLDLPGPGPGSAPVGFARVVTGVLPNGKPRAELAVVTKDRLVLASLAADGSKFDVRDLTELLGSPLSGRISAVASGDFDGDGVPDLAIADSGAVRLVRQQPRLR